jgi:hypothetical protein
MLCSKRVTKVAIPGEPLQQMLDHPSDLVAVHASGRREPDPKRRAAADDVSRSVSWSKGAPQPYGTLEGMAIAIPWAGVLVVASIPVPKSRVGDQRFRSGERDLKCLQIMEAASKVLVMVFPSGILPVVLLCCWQGFYQSSVRLQSQASLQRKNMFPKAQEL